MSHFEISSTQCPEQTLGFIGSVEDVIAGKIASELRTKVFSAKDFAYGFEIASPCDTLEAMGEAILLNSWCYATSTEENSKNHLSLIYGQQFYTSGMFIIPKDAHPTHRVSCSEMDLTTFYHRVFEQVAAPFAFIGVGRFDVLHCAALVQPPIHGRPIFENKKEFYPRPPTKKSDVFAFVMGAVTDYTLKSALNRSLSVVLYHNPLDQQTALTTHMHALELKEPIKEVEMIQPQHATHVWHAFEQGTKISEFKAEVYTIKNLKNLFKKRSG